MSMFKFIGGIAVGAIAVMTIGLWYYAVDLQHELNTLKQN